MDTVSKKKRSEIMQAVRGKDTKIEFILRKALWKEGYRYRKNDGRFIGKPDIVLPSNKIAIFVDSCFWHGCPYHCRMPHSNKAYWNAKIKRNKERDREVNKWYRKNKWIILRFWEHSVSGDVQMCIKKIKSLIDKQTTAYHPNEP